MMCHYCGQPGEWLCDHVVRPAPDPASKRPEDRVLTCDRPLCSLHRRVKSSGIICTRGGKGHGRGCCRPFSVDHCPEHSGESLS